MNAREYLESFKIVEDRLQARSEQVRKLEERLTSITVPLDKEQVSHTKNVAVMADTVAEIVDMQNEIKQQAKECAAAKTEALRLLAKLKLDYSEILSEKFFEGKTFREIGKVMFITERQAQRKYKEALAAFQTILDEAVKCSPEKMSPHVVLMSS